MNLNEVRLAGRLTRDPEMRYTGSNTAVCSFSVATNRKWRNQQGESQEEVTFVDVTAWAKTAEAIHQYFRKGSSIFISGRLQLEQWDDRDGKKRSKLSVVCENFQFTESKRDSDEARPARREPASSLPPQQGNHKALEEGDIPF